MLLLFIFLDSRLDLYRQYNECGRNVYLHTYESSTYTKTKRQRERDVLRNFFFFSKRSLEEEEEEEKIHNETFLL